jgi:hypothetical protein
MNINRNSFQFSVFSFRPPGPKLKIQNWKLLVMIPLAFFISAANNRAQPVPPSHASDFTSVEYFEAPHQQQIKSRLTGAEAQPLTGGLLAIKQLKLEMFDVNGRLQIVADAPECVYDTMSGMASSSGRLQVRTGDGKFHVEGEGFLWRQNGSLLTISNNVQTVIENATEIAP